MWAVGTSMVRVKSVDERVASVLHCDGWGDAGPNWQASDTSVADAGSPEQISFNAIHGNASSGVWIVGNGGKTRYSAGWKADGTAWTPVNSRSSKNLNAVWCSPDADVWAAGEGGSMVRFTREGGGEYAALTVDVPTTGVLRALWGFAPDDVWAVGDAGTILHWDGKAWTTDGSSQGLTEDLFAIWGSSKDDLWIAGQNVLLHKGSASLPTEIQ
ncbi:Type IV fimbrial biogenesis protein PilY1 [Labilithrix luteola]|uniref:Type IV fimbrial biogenesis protein PilY1 n=1 Tax=Labilithrix luteola TaxID=1391654 RepID=A0A0K1PTU1_9BACT|nr:Type IV fimbrial biogenesis protein PilY1 [Labilithrix luteola]